MVSSKSLFFPNYRLWLVVGEFSGEDCPLRAAPTWLLDIFLNILNEAVNYLGASNDAT